MQNFKWLLRVAREAVNRWRMKTNQAALQQNLDARSPSAGRSQRSPAAPGTVRRGYGYGPKAVAWRNVQIRPAREQKS